MQNSLGNKNLTTKDILYLLKKEVTSNNYNNFLQQLVYKKPSSSDDLAVFEVSNKFLASYIQTKFSSTIKDVLKANYGTKPTILIKVTGEKRKAKKDILKESSSAQNRDTTLLNPSYTFESFVVGSSNKMAYNASIAVSKEPAIVYNPLFIYGGTGLGKTHLLQAIGNNAIEKGKSVIYVTSEQFVNAFTFAIKSKGMDSFRSTYRKCDLLLIDDIQFISGKDGTQEEFFHTFNELHIAKKQIVLTADKLPSQIAGLEERLRSRFEWGLMADITIPNLETKIAIIEKKIEINCMKLNKEVINYIASNFDNSVRAIEGVLIKIRATADLFDGEINLELVQNLLKDQIQEIKDNIKLPDIISVVSNELNIKPSDLKTKRTKSAVTARRIVIFLARELTHNSMPEIAKNLGMKDHSAVSKNISKANELIQKDENFKLLLDNLKNKFINKEY
jgi:chromosomal replication initiator protein